MLHICECLFFSPPDINSADELLQQVCTLNIKKKTTDIFHHSFKAHLSFNELLLSIF